MKAIYMALLTMVTVLVVAAVGCSRGHVETTVERSRLVVDGRYDAIPSPAAQTFIEPYRRHVDSLMSPVVAVAARNLDVDRPESPLSNLLADILLWAGDACYGERPDMAVYNIGGIRASIQAGDITLGDIIDVAPFNNKICFLTLSGTQMRRLLEQIAASGGEGVSHGVCLHINGDGQLASATINGMPLDTARSYRIATLDYLAEGNDGLTAFKTATAVNAPAADSCNVRHIIIRYMRQLNDAGIPVDARNEGRIVVE